LILAATMPQSYRCNKLHLISFLNPSQQKIKLIIYVEKNNNLFVEKK